MPFFILVRFCYNNEIMDEEVKTEPVQQEENKDKVKIVKYDPERNSLEELEKAVSLAYLANRDFFGEEVGGIEVNFLQTREEMDKIFGKETPNWMVGLGKNTRKIYIFAPSAYDKVSTHHISDFPLILTHEMAHVFDSAINGPYKNQYPKWLKEGIPGVVAKQYERSRNKKIKVQPFKELTDLREWNKHPNYEQAFCFTKYLVDQFGKEAVLDLLKLASQEGSLVDFPDTLKKVTGQDFDKVSKEWLASREK